MTAISSAFAKTDGASTASMARRRLDRHRGLLIAIAVFLLLLAVVSSVGSVALSYYDLSQMATSGATLALAAIGQTIVIISGGFDLSAGAAISLVNVVLASTLQDPATSPFVVIAAGVGIGVLSGAFNGFFVAVLRMQPIVVTLSTMFILQGITLLVMDKPGGAVSPAVSDLLIGDAIPNLLPKPILLIIILLGLWTWLKRTRFGTAIYAIGSDLEVCARRRRIDPLRAVHGLCHRRRLLRAGRRIHQRADRFRRSARRQPHAAADVRRRRGRRHGARGRARRPLGTVFGAYILMMVVNILLVLNVSAYYSTVAEGTILILAVLAGSLNRDSQLARQIRYAVLRTSARRHGMLPGQRSREARSCGCPTSVRRRGPEPPIPASVVRYAETLRFALPAYICFALVVIATQLVLGHALTSWSYFNSLIVLSSFLAVLALGQGSVILTGGLDLSLPWTIGLCGILLAGMVKGSDAALLYALPAVLIIGALIGLVNGAGIVLLGISPIVMTLAMNGILQGLALVYSNGMPDGFSSPLLRRFMTDHELFFTPVVPFVRFSRWPPC